MQLFIDDMLRVWGIMKLGTSEFEMIEFFITIFTRKDLKLIRNIPDFISKEAEEFIIHIAFFEDFYETIIVHLIKD